MTIGLDAKRIVRNATGLGSYGRTLANDLAKVEGLDLRLYAPDRGRDDLRQQVAETDNLCFCYPPGHPTSLGKAYWRSKGIVKQLKADGVGLFHGLSGELPLGIKASGIKTVVTIHDLIFLRHPEYYNWIDTKVYAWKFRQTLREAHRIVAISECTRRDISELGGIDVSDIDLVYQSCAPRFQASVPPDLQRQVSEKYHLPARYILSVGSIEERKNMLLAVKALPLLPSNVALVMVGRPTAYVKQLQAFIDNNRLNNRVVMLHGVPDNDLPAIYIQAEAFAYPSRYEGFGIPIIEAIGMGLPVVACTGSCLEEAGGPDSLYADPDDAEAMANALSQCLRGADGRQRRIELSRKYIERFANTQAASKFADIYHQLLP